MTKLVETIAAALSAGTPRQWMIGGASFELLDTT